MCSLRHGKACIMMGRKGALLIIFLLMVPNGDLTHRRGFLSFGVCVPSGWHHPSAVLKSTHCIVLTELKLCPKFQFISQWYHLRRCRHWQQVSESPFEHLTSYTYLSNDASQDPKAIQTVWPGKLNSTHRSANLSPANQYLLHLDPESVTSYKMTNH